MLDEGLAGSCGTMRLVSAAQSAQCSRRAWP